MPTYISLIKYTRQGITTIKEGPDRLDANRELLNRYGSGLEAFYLTRAGMTSSRSARYPTTPPPRRWPSW